MFLRDFDHTVYETPIEAVIDTAATSVKEAEQAVEDAGEAARRAALDDLPGRVGSLATRLEEALSAINGRVDTIATQTEQTAVVVKDLAVQVSTLAGTTVEQTAGAGADVTTTAAELPEAVIEPGIPGIKPRGFRHHLRRLV